MTSATQRALAQVTRDLNSMNDKTELKNMLKTTLAAQKKGKQQVGAITSVKVAGKKVPLY